MLADKSNKTITLSFNNLHCGFTKLQLDALDLTASQQTVYCKAE